MVGHPANDWVVAGGEKVKECSHGRYALRQAVLVKVIRGACTLLSLVAVVRFIKTPI
jgi:hypothetical protein